MLIAISHNLQSKKSFALTWDFAPMKYEHTSHIITFYNSCFQRPCGFMLHGRLLFSPPLWQKGGEKMMNNEQYREHIERTFNAFCKIVLYHCGAGRLQKNTEEAAV